MEIDVICSGSMLGINYKKIHSNSVGNKTDYEMFSMDFEEFLWAKGYGEEQIDSIRKHMIDLKPFSETELNIYKSLFLDYCVLGGMPEVVRDMWKQVRSPDRWKHRSRSGWIMRKMSENMQKVWIRQKL